VGASVRIPGLEIGEELGHGAYSIVYEARQGETRCALKVPHTRGRWTRWVYREALALARVRHPGLPRVLEVGESDGLPYIAMELVEGETLADRLMHGPLPAVQALDLACQLADTLRAVHDVGLVHRDVKPRNVILEAAGKVRLVDFGFAAPIGTLGVRDAAGTRRYSAPEQFHSPDRVDARADLYALGRVLYECLLGAPCAESESTRAVVALITGGVSASVARIVAGLLGEAPEDRYPDAASLLADLHRVRAGGVPRGAATYEPTRPAGALVGRDGELEQFTRAWRSVEATGGRVILLEGIRGMGKTRFLRTCIAKICEEGRGRSLACTCRQDDAPLSAVRRMFELYLASLSRLPPQERAAATAALRTAASGPLAAVVSVVAPAFSELFGIAKPSAAVMPPAFAEAAAELMVRLARLSGPLLLSFDDLQWADGPSLEVLAAIADRAHEGPLLLLLASRPAGPGATFERFDTVDPRCTSRICLGPLETRQGAAIIAAHLGIASAEPSLVRRIVAMADATPVGILEALGAFLDAGALRYRANAWQLDEPSVERVALPSGALAYLGTRVAELPPATRSVLEVAALLGTRFRDQLLAEVLELAVSDVEHALADGRRAGLLEPVDGRDHAFTHDTLREMLARELDETRRRQWHQRAAARLVHHADANPELLYACAAHFAAGGFDHAPETAYRVARRAAELALERFDNETALRLFDMARSCARVARLTPDAGYHRKVGEAHLRVGALDESLRCFEQALELAEGAELRASILGRIVWVQRSRSEPDRAWEALDRAFSAIGATMPTEDAPSSARRRSKAGSAAAGGDVLYELLNQHARFGVECGKPLRSLQSSVHALSLTRGEGPSMALARAHATHGAVLAFIGRRVEASRRLADAQAMAERLGDPATIAYCLPRRLAALAFDGQFDASLVLLRECADSYGPWMEVNEFCDTVANGDFIETIRGRVTEASGWTVRAIDRLRRRRRPSEPFASHLLHRARAALVGMGRAGQEGPWLAAQTEAAAGWKPEKAYYRTVSWGPQARIHFDGGTLGPAFEELVGRVQAEGHNPAACHPILIEYYVTVAHARMHQRLRCAADERDERTAALRLAATDLRAAAKLPLYQSHAVLADAYLAWFDGQEAKATRLLAKAESLAQRHTCPWVLWGVARARAHMLRDQGNVDAARDQARIAEVLARENGAESRARWVREEFSLASPRVVNAAGSSASSSVRSSRRARRQLASLLHVARAPYGQLRYDQQARAIVDDLVRELAADRAFLLYEPESPRAKGMLLGRTRLGESLPPPGGWREAVMRTVMEGAEPPGDSSIDGLLDVSPDRKRVLVVPLFLNERTLGAVCVERSGGDAPFTPDDHELLSLLAHQLPLGLELSRLLEERDEVQASLQQVQKMEVVGELASGVAHDVNNMLTGISTGLQGLQENEHLDQHATEDVRLIEDGLTRAMKLTRKLLSFSRRQPLALASTNLSAAIESLEPMIRRLVRNAPGVDLALDLDMATHPALTDESLLEQALVNLVLNGRDAMHGRGRVTVSTRNVKLGAEAVRRGAPAEGDYVVVAVSDQGDGIPADVLPRIFDPFFTTKPAGKGTGLGLTMVYSFAQQCGGYVDVASEVGRGTTFRLFLPRAEPIHVEKPRSSTPPPASGIPAMILVVDDDPSLRDRTRALLQDSGYRVITASGSSDALRVVQSQGGEISLVILDANLSEMDGTELGRRLADLHVPAKVLFVTGSTAGADEPPMLQKPFTRSDLLKRVRGLLDA
jgi:signal transduction histidine kinase/CheY-like chemotaxis protein/tetratricopeptide (TPR) repeat protein